MDHVTTRTTTNCETAGVIMCNDIHQFCTMQLTDSYSPSTLQSNKQEHYAETQCPFKIQLYQEHLRYEGLGKKEKR